MRGTSRPPSHVTSFSASSRSARRTDSTIIDDSSMPNAGPTRLGGGIFNGICTKLANLSSRLTKNWRKGSKKRSSTVSQTPSLPKPPGNQYPTFLDPVLTFSEEEKALFGAASICGIRPYNEDSYRVITNLELFSKSFVNDNLTTKALLDTLIRATTVEAEDLQQLAQLNASFDPKLAPSSPKTRRSSNPKIMEGSQFYGVFDGHAGKRCSTVVAHALPFCIAASDAFQHDTDEAIRAGCLTMDKYFLDAASARGYKDGCTAIAMLVRRRHITIANIGDCRAILCCFDSSTNHASTQALSKDQKPNCAEEKSRIEAAGGIVLNIRGVPRVNGMLAVARAFGDLPLKRYIVAEPVVTQHDLREMDEYIILATDGLWDVLSNDAVWNFVRTHKGINDELHDVASQLAQAAVDLGSADNVTVVIVDVRCRR